MPAVRPAAVAGTFYPADEPVLRSFVESAAGRAATSSGEAAGLKAVIAPHAGYVYSGSVAGSAYARVRAIRDRVTRVVLLGPAHRTAVAAIAAPAADAFSTPLGLVRVDGAGRGALVDAGLVVVSDDVHAEEHSLEVQLPFLQVCLGDVVVLPLAVGRVGPADVAAVLEQLWGGEETLVVVSSDLSHYLDHATATERDRRTAAAIVSKRPEQLGGNDACGVVPIQGLLIAADRHQLDIDLLDLRTSADTAGDPDRVVGYGAFALAEVSPPLDPAEVDALFALADTGIRAGLDGHRAPTVEPTTLAPALQERRGAFVTLEVAGDLNGCIGAIDAVEPLGAAVSRLAWDAAFADPRLPPLSAGDYPSLEIKLSLIGPLQPLPAASEADLVAALRPGVDGLVIRSGATQATFLPAVWQKLADPLAFLRHLEAKAGLAPGRWPAEMRAWRYTATEYRRRAVDTHRASSSVA